MSEFVQMCSRAWVFGFIGGMLAGIVIGILKAVV